MEIERSTLAGFAACGTWVGGPSAHRLCRTRSERGRLSESEKAIGERETERDQARDRQEWEAWILDRARFSPHRLGAFVGLDQREGDWVWARERPVRGRLSKTERETKRWERGRERDGDSATERPARERVGGLGVGSNSLQKQSTCIHIYNLRMTIQWKYNPK